MKSWVRSTATAATLLTLSAGLAHGAGLAKDYRLTPLSSEPSAAGARLHGAVCRTTVQVRRQSPAVVLRRLDDQGRVVSAQSMALYGAHHERTAGCAFFNATVGATAGGRVEVCLMDGERPGQCVAGPGPA